MRSLNRWLALNVIAEAGSQQGIDVGSFRARAQTGTVGFSGPPDRDLIDRSGMGVLLQHSFPGDESALIARELPPTAARKPQVLLENDD